MFICFFFIFIFFNFYFYFILLYNTVLVLPYINMNFFHQCFIVFSLYRSFVSLGRYIPKYFSPFIAMVNEIVSFISLSVFSLLVYGNARDFCVLIL